MPYLGRVSCKTLSTSSSYNNCIIWNNQWTRNRVVVRSLPVARPVRNVNSCFIRSTNFNIHTIHIDWLISYHTIIYSHYLRSTRNIFFIWIQNFAVFVQVFDKKMLIIKIKNFTLEARIVRRSPPMLKNVSASADKSFLNKIFKKSSEEEFYEEKRWFGHSKKTFNFFSNLRFSIESFFIKISFRKNNFSRFIRRSNIAGAQFYQRS